MSSDLNNGMHSEPDDDMSDDENETKPPVPYIKDWQFTVQQHNPPPPTKPTSGDCTVEDIGETNRLKQLQPIERCLKNPPAEGSYGPFSLDLRIHDTMRIGDKHHAQVVVVEVLTADPPVEGLSQGELVVAKIYDPLYVDNDDLYINPFVVADKHYTHEDAAYKALSDLQGSVIPKYYGSYSLDVHIPIPIDLSTKRCVRLTLMELIPGSSMRNVDPHGLSQQTRQQIMKSLIELYTLAYSREIILVDTHPRNVMLTSSVSGHAPAVFIDFGDALFGWAWRWPRRLGSLPSTYVSPLLLFHEGHGRPREFQDWIDWDWQPWLEAEFGHTAVSISPQVRDIFLPLKLVNGKLRPKN